jgi:hypothetical protein
MKKQRTKEEKKQLAKNIIKYTLGTIGLGVFCYAGYKYVTSDTPRPHSPELDKLVEDTVEQWNKDKEVAYAKGGHDELMRMMMYCFENGKSIVGTASSISNKPEDAQCWLVAELVTEKPDLPDILTDDPYTTYINKE